MNICLVSEEYPEETNFGGIATYQKRIASALTKIGNRVFVICRALDCDKEYEEEGIHIIRIYKESLESELESYTNYRKKVCYIINKLVKEKKIDIIEVADWGAEAVFYSEIKTIPMVVKLHTPLCIWSIFNKRGLEKSVNNQMLIWEKKSIENADKVISCTKILRKLVFKNFNFNKKIKIEVVPNPGNINGFFPEKSAHKTKRILFCGSIEQRKGVLILAEAIAIVLDELKDSEIKFVFAGKDTTRNDKNISTIEYIKQIVPSKYHNNLEFLGQQKNEDLCKIYNSSRIGIVPSLFDNLPYVAMEQMLTEMPLIASRNTGVKEMIRNNKSGILYNELNPNALAKSIIKLYKKERFAEKLGQNARREALNKYDPETIAKRMQAIYLDLIENRSAN